MKLKLVLMILFWVVFILRHSCLCLSLSFPMYLSLYLSFLSKLWHFPEVFYCIRLFPQGELLWTSKCIEGGVGWWLGLWWGWGVYSPYISTSPIYSITFQQIDVVEHFRGYLYWLCSHLKKHCNSIIIFIHSEIFEHFNILFLQNIKSQPNTK